MREKLIAYLQREGVSGAFAVKDLRSGEICSFNEDEVVASASLIKMFILIRAFQKIRAGEMTLDDQIEVRRCRGLQRTAVSRSEKVQPERAAETDDRVQ